MPFNQIQSDWIRNDRFDSFSKEECWLYAYYMTTNQNIIGIYREEPWVTSRRARLKDEEELRRLQAKLAKEGLCGFEGPWIWIIGKAKRSVKGENLIKKAFKVWNELPDRLKMKKEFLLVNPYLATKFKGLSKGGRRGLRQSIYNITSKSISKSTSVKSSKMNPKESAQGKSPIGDVSLPFDLTDPNSTENQNAFIEFQKDIKQVCGVYVRHRNREWQEGLDVKKEGIRIFQSMMNLSIYGSLRKPKTGRTDYTDPDVIVKIIHKLKKAPRTNAMRYLEWAVQHKAEVL